MNFFPNGNNMMLPPNMVDNNIVNKIMELENRIKKLEQRIIKLENNNNPNYNEPDNSLYMI